MNTRWVGAALVTAMVLTGYVWFGYALLRAALWLLDRAGLAGW